VINMYEKEIRQIEEFIKTNTSTVNGAVVGVSGGLDSAVVATLCVRALGKDKVKLVHMPEDYEHIDRDAEKLAKNLGMDMEIINIQETLKMFRLASWDTFSDKLSYGNLKSRIRMTILYGRSNKYNLLVVGTTNYSEWMVGYFTKYGDGGTDIEPIMHIFKTDLYNIAKELKEIPQEIIDKAPTAGLWDGQTDENEMGVTYAELDINLRRRLNDKPISEKVAALIKNSCHKRQTIPNMLFMGGI